MHILVAEARNLASRDSTGREEIIKAVREGHHGFSVNKNKGSESGNALYAGDGTGGGHGKGGGHGNEKRGRRGKHGLRVRGNKEHGGGAEAAAGGDGSSAKSTEGSALVRACYRCGKEDNLRANCTEKLCKSVQLTWAHC